jgi:hypothetical protein
MADPKIPRDIAAEAAKIGGTDPRAELERKVKAMDPPTRASAAVAMAVEGAPYPDIAHVLGYPDARRAKEAVWAAIADAGADHDDVAKMRTLQSQRLDRLLYSVMRRATKPSDADHLSYARIALAIMDRQAKLYGLDAAQQVVVYTPTQREIAEYAEKVAELHRAARGAIEADIIDAEIVLDEEAHGAPASRAS